MGSDGFSRFPRRRHFHSWLAVSCVAANPMWSKSNRDCLVQMFMHRDSAASQGSPELGSFQLPNAIGKADRVIPRYHALVLQRENQVQLFPPHRHKGGPAFGGRHTEATIELPDIFIPQKLINEIGNAHV